MPIYLKPGISEPPTDLPTRAHYSDGPVMDAPLLEKQGIREYTGSLKGCWCMSFDGSISIDGIQIFPSEADRLEATKNMTEEEINEYYKQLNEKGRAILDNVRNT